MRFDLKSLTPAKLKKKMRELDTEYNKLEGIIVQATQRQLFLKGQFNLLEQFLRGEDLVKEEEKDVQKENLPTGGTR